MESLEIDPLIIEILSRLPVDSLLRFKSVCKSWYALINDPKFATKHCSISLQQHSNPLLLKRFVMNNSGIKEIVFSILKSPLFVHRSVSFLGVDLSIGEKLEFFEIYGYSHGLLCLSAHLHDIILCNPTTGEFRKLPPSILFSTPELPADPYPDGYDSIPRAVGFGYDAKSRDFKVLRVVDFMHPAFYPNRVEIYDLSKDRWRVIDSPTACAYVEDLPLCQLYHEGTYYWFAYTHDQEEVMQSFDMSEEVFGLISLPESFEKRLIKYKSMGILNGSMILFHSPTNTNENVFDVWKMEKSESSSVVGWSKLLRIGPVSGIEKPLLFVSSDELLMEANEGTEVILYNIITQQLKALPMKGHPKACLQAIFFDMTCLSVKGGNNITYEF